MQCLCLKQPWHFQFGRRVLVGGLVCIVLQFNCSARSLLLLLRLLLIIIMQAAAMNTGKVIDQLHVHCHMHATYNNTTCLKRHYPFNHSTAACKQVACQAVCPALGPVVCGKHNPVDNMHVMQARQYVPFHQCIMANGHAGDC